MHPYQVKVIPYILNILLYTRSIYILIIRAKPSLGADYFLIPTPIYPFEKSVGRWWKSCYKG